MKHYVIGLFFLVLSKCKYHLAKYTPKPIDRVDDCINYDFSVVSQWEEHASKYFPNYSIQDKTILELGPGADLGIATILLSKGAESYYAFDIHDLVKNVQPDFYEKLIDKIAERSDSQDTLPPDLLDTVLTYSRTGEGKINYICKNTIDFSEIKDRQIDVVFSQAAFEHLDNPQQALSLLSTKCKSGSILVAQVDLKSHSRWVRSNDPLNIYKYNDFLYNLLSHKASPNRVRPSQYQSILKDNGWGDIQIITVKSAVEPYLTTARKYIQKEFLDDHIASLSIMILARKK
ncbi:methyltransferase domain-containing protein [Desulfovibrio ferrophilus]|uniref:Methyltransferase type 11 domain-containing protein n=1 Tax=Desulfovibrio ferrophilus TaxID=241368 RepID=A0A2Z6AWT1_9BACT|nr:methyltransferase domain-containing protein [Desulfovibrio ferrophilus]BBD07709.1 uncharacterized protein DFE_0983 [Desulfovibrio ferrophilus]